MATPLTSVHRVWRTKIFTATWLSYVGYYFCRKPYSAAKAAIGKEYEWDASTLADIWAAYLFAYALGQFLASQVGQRFGPRRMLLVGMATSIGVTLAMGVTPSVPVLTGLVVLNGLAQATGWSGNVGTMAHWFHRHERGRVLGGWSTNFTVGSLASTYMMAWVLSIHAKGEAEPWRWCFYTGAAVLSVVWIQFFFLQRNRPEDVGLAPIDDPKTDVDESTASEPVASGPMGLSRTAWTNLWLVAGFYFCSKFIRYAVWSWSAYFLTMAYGLSSARANVYATLFDILGVVGVFVTGWLSDRFFQSRRAGVSLIMVVAMMVSTLLLILFRDSGVTVFAILLGAIGFTLYGPDALLTGAGAIDIGGRRTATFVTAFISGVGSIGPVLQEVVIGRMYDSKSGDLGPVFVLLFGNATMAAVFCAILVYRGRRGRGV